MPEGADVEEIALPTAIVKRDGRTVAFDPAKIAYALDRCFVTLYRKPETPAADLAQRVINVLSARRWLPTAEIVQDVIELTLQGAGEFEAARAYIAYRSKRETAVPASRSRGLVSADAQ